MSVRAALVDLDGTLIDSKSGICGSVQYALAALGEPVPSADDLEWVIGPPMIDSLRKLVGPARAEEAQKLYRARYAEIGLFDNRVYDGIPELLTRLKAEGWALHVATSKIQPFALEIIEHLGFRPLFGGVYGAGADGSLLHKDALLAHVLADTGLDPARTIMIGDREFDILAARANGLRAIGVTWGYGSEAELRAACAAALIARACEAPAALDRLLG